MTGQLPAPHSATPQGVDGRSATRRLAAALFLVLWSAGAAPAQPASGPDVSVRTMLDRTAVWVGDRVTYTVEITCRRGADVLMDDVARDKLKLDGLDIVSTETERNAEADAATRYDFRYVLTTYRVDVPALKIAPFQVRYYIKRAGERVDDAAPAGAVQVPGASIAFRSVLPDDQGAADVRDTRVAAERPAIFRALEPVGIGLIVLSVAPVALLAIGLARRASERRHAAGHRTRRQARHEARAALEAVRDAGIERPEARREAFARLDALVRQHLGDVAGIPAASLTPEEIAIALEARPSRVQAGAVASILKICELARYGVPEQVPSADAWHDTLAQAEQVIGA